MTAAGAAFLPGARGRLLPPAVPFGFFGAAVVFHLAAWVVLLLASSDVPAFRGGSGPVLAALHLVTLGVLATTAMGAAFQLLPVATHRPLAAVWPVRVVFWLLVPGIAALGHGMAAFDGIVLAAGAALCVTALALAGGLLAVNLWGTSGMAVVRGFAGAALVGLFAVIALGAMLAGTLAGLWPPVMDHGRVAAMHLVLGGYGFMGLLAMGFSYVLVPMFALAPAPGSRAGIAALVLAAAGIVVAVVGIGLQSVQVVSGAALLGLGAATLYLYGMAGAMKQRMRRRLGISFLLVRVAWVFLPVSIVVGAAAAVGLAGDNGPALFGFVLYAGWLLTFLLGILQRIMPFLASMHAARAGRQPPLVSELSARTPMVVHAACHCGAVVLAAAGIAADLPVLVTVGAALGIAGALAFLWFAVQVIHRMALRRHGSDGLSSAAAASHD